jgi:arabinan endo-1,5-alpha-L-arabinosidase
VHEFHLNAEAWPVVAPLRYVPLAMNPTTLMPEVSAADAAGSYKLVNHGKDITASVKASVVVSLLADGSLGGAMAGRWSHDGSNRVTVTPTGQAAFSGVLSRGWNPNTSAFTVCFSALSAEGVALWGLRTGPAA